MKLNIILLFFAFGHSLSAQQDWDLFPLQQRSYIQIEEDLKIHYNDSTEFLGNQERLHHFGQKYYHLPFDSCQYEFLTNDDFWTTSQADRPFKDTLYSNSSFFYKNISEDTLQFYHKGTVGFSWFIPTFSEDSIKITVVGMEEGEALHGYIDSIKTYRMEVWSDGATVQHPLNTITFRLGKNLGLLEWVKWEDLYFLEEDAKIRHLFSFEKMGEKYGFTGAFSDYIHPEVGEIYKYKSFFWPSTHPHFIFERDSITEVWENETALYTAVRRDILTIMNQENIYQYDVKDTVIYLKTLEHYFEQAPDAPLFDYVDIEDSFIYFGFDNKYLKLVDGFIYDEQNHVGDFFTDWENCWMDVIEYPLNYSMKYNTLSGFFSRSEYIFNVNGESGNYKHLIGHQTNDGVVFGEVEVLTTTTNVQTKGLNMQIYPNPIQGEFYVQLEDYQEIEPAKIILYNSFGQQIWQQYLSGEVETMIDISSHASGIYFVHLWITGKPVAHQKLIKL